MFFFFFFFFVVVVVVVFCGCCCFDFVFSKKMLAHGKQFPWILQQSCHLIFCVRVTTIKMVSTVRVN